MYHAIFQLSKCPHGPSDFGALLTCYHMGVCIGFIIIKCIGKGVNEPVAMAVVHGQIPGPTVRPVGMSNLKGHSALSAQGYHLFAHQSYSIIPAMSQLCIV